MTVFYLPYTTLFRSHNDTNYVFDVQYTSAYTKLLYH